LTAAWELLNTVTKARQQLAKRWFAQPYITLAGDDEKILWEGIRAERDDPAAFAEQPHSAARDLLEATLGMNFSNPHKG
jgi:hypothetical protein